MGWLDVLISMSVLGLTKCSQAPRATGGWWTQKGVRGYTGGELYGNTRPIGGLWGDKEVVHQCTGCFQTSLLLLAGQLVFSIWKEGDANVAMVANQERRIVPFVYLSYICLQQRKFAETSSVWPAKQTQSVCNIVIPLFKYKIGWQLSQGRIVFLTNGNFSKKRNYFFSQTGIS